MRVTLVALWCLILLRVDSKQWQYKEGRYISKFQNPESEENGGRSRTSKSHHTPNSQHLRVPSFTKNLSIYRELFGVQMQSVNRTKGRGVFLEENSTQKKQANPGERMFSKRRDNDSNGTGCLVPEDFQKFLKILRDKHTRTFISRSPNLQSATPGWYGSRQSQQLVITAKRGHFENQPPRGATSEVGSTTILGRARNHTKTPGHRRINRGTWTKARRIRETKNDSLYDLNDKGELRNTSDVRDALHNCTVALCPTACSETPCHSTVKLDTTTRDISPPKVTLATSKSAVSHSLGDTTRVPGYVYCEPVTARGIYWPLTLAGRRVLNNCPTNTTGAAWWFCDTDGKWWPRYADLRNCTSVWSFDISDMSFGQSARQALSVLYKYAEKHVSAMYGGDIVTLSRQMAANIQKHVQEAMNLTEGKKRETAEEILQLVFNVSDTLLSPLTAQAWFDIPSGPARRQPALQVIEGLEQEAFLLCDIVESCKVTEKKNTYAITAVSFTKHVTETSGVMFPSGNLYDEYGASIHLPSGFQQDVAGEKFSGVFIAYSTLQGMLANDLEDPKTNATKYLGSKVISATLGSPKTSLKFQNGRQVRLVFQKNIIKNNSKEFVDATCVFWTDVEHRSGQREDTFWSSEGCSLVHSNETHVECQCDHLTNFAILLDVTGASREASDADKHALNVITHIGCGLSVVGLLLCILTFSCFRNLWCLRNTIHRNLCICLLVGEVIFLVGVDKTEDKLACKVVAVGLHLSFLSAFSWMCLEGIQMYLLLVRVFTTRCSVLWYYLAGYGIPVVIVSFSFAFLKDGYGSNYSCWLNSQDLTILAFAVPAGCVLVANFVILCIALRIADQQTKRKIKICGGHQLCYIKVWIKGSMTLVSLLGCTWSVGFFYLSQETVVFAYLFTLLNATQGLFIFIFHCCTNEAVRSQWKSAILRRCPLAIVRGSLHSYNSSTSSRISKRRSTQETHFNEARSNQIEDKI